jgi:hypothetical protein
VIAQGKDDTDSYTVVLTRKPEDDAKVIVKAFAPLGLKFKSINDVPVPGSETSTLVFTAADWNVAQKIEFTADEQGAAEVATITHGGSGQNEEQLLVIGATKGTFTLSLGHWKPKTSSSIRQPPASRRRRFKRQSMAALVLRSPSVLSPPNRTRSCSPTRPIPMWTNSRWTPRN